VSGSVGLFSAAAESVVNLVVDGGGAVGADLRSPTAGRGARLRAQQSRVLLQWFGERPHTHRGGRDRGNGVGRLMDPQPLENVVLGCSITLRADAHHLLTDVWTSLSVVLAVALAQLTGWLALDPLIGLAVAANIVWRGCDCCVTPRKVCSTKPSLPKTRKPSPRSSRAARREEYGSTPCARGPPGSVGLSRCTYSCRDCGRYSRGTISQRTLREDRVGSLRSVAGEHLLHPRRALRGPRILRGSEPGSRTPRWARLEIKGAGRTARPGPAVGRLD
jgi:hypothetical protein